jgi:hypothetical protein
MSLQSGSPVARRHHARFAPTRWLVLGCLAAVAAACGGSGSGHARGPAEERIVFSSLEGLSCVAESDCVAVGSFVPLDADAATGDPDGDASASHTLVESYDGRHWTTRSSPDEGKGGAVLSAVSCPSAGDCVAVGYFQPKRQDPSSSATPARFPLVENFEGGKWRTVSSPAVAPNSALLGVSCPTESSCWAVGDTTTSQGATSPVESFFIETNAGGVWRVAPVATPKAMSTNLGSIACSAVASCVAVGSVAPANDSSATHPLVEELNGSSWGAVALPTAASGFGILSAVQCTSTLHCFAVGNTANTRAVSVPLVLSVAGAIWQVNEAALGETGESSLTAVACVARASCTVGGTSAASLSARPTVLIATVNATIWRVQAVADASGFVRAISCPQATGCRIVGSDGSDTLLADLTDGVWTVQPRPAP